MGAHGCVGVAVLQPAWMISFSEPQECSTGNKGGAATNNTKSRQTQ